MAINALIPLHVKDRELPNLDADRLQRAHADLYQSQARRTNEQDARQRRVFELIRRAGGQLTPEIASQAAAIDPTEGAKLQGVVSRQATDTRLAEKAGVEAKEAEVKAKQAATLAEAAKHRRVAGQLQLANTPEGLASAIAVASQSGDMSPEEAQALGSLPFEQFMAQRPMLLRRGEELAKSLEAEGKAADETRKVAEEGRKVAGEKRTQTTFDTNLPAVAAKALADKKIADATAADPNLLNPAQKMQAENAKAATLRAEKAAKEQQRHNLATEAAANRRAAAAEAGKGEGRGLNEQAINKLEGNKALSDKLGNLEATFQDDFAGLPLLGGLENIVGKMGGESIGLTTPGQTDFWQEYQTFVNQVRKELFGSALTATEKGEFEKAMVDPSTAPVVVKSNLARQKKVIDDALNRRAQAYGAGGFNKAQIDIYRPAQQAPKGGDQSGPKKISGDAEYDALPPGTEFIDPNGKPRRKP